MEADELDQTFVETLRRKIQSRPITILREEAGSSSRCIYRVPPTLRQHEMVYTPQLVSLGPFHRSNQTLQAMEQHKLMFLHKALSRANTHNRLETFLSAIKAMEQSARDCYSEMIDLDSNKFVEMMVLDGCFIIQIVLIRTQSLTADQDDPVFSQGWLWHGIKRDMLLLENQIPFSVLQVLFDLITSSMGIEGSLVSIFCRFFEVFRLYKQRSSVTPRHLLHLLQLCAIPDPKRPPTNLTTEEIPSATRLHKAGVKFKCVNENSFLNIVFEDGELRVPPLYIGDDICSLFPNLIAFEQCYTEYCGQYITAYITFMDWLIDSAADVLILRRNGIIEHLLGSDEEVADLFNKLGRDVIPFQKYFYLSDVVRDINRFRHRYQEWRSWRVSLKQKYLYNPWAFISLIGATILLLLTALQTFFAVFSYFRPPS